MFDDNRFYYETYGGGLPLFFIHGNGDSINSFKGQIEDLSTRHRVIAMDSRGQGGNQPHIPLADLTRIQVPTLVMAGDRDVIRDEHTLRIFHAIPKSQLAIFPGATHLIPAQDPPRFNRTVLDFFDKPFAMLDTRTET